MTKNEYMLIMAYIQLIKCSSENIGFRDICDIESKIRDVFYKNVSDPSEFPTTGEVEKMYKDYLEVLKKNEDESK